MFEPKRQSDLSLLQPYVRDRVERILERMRARGFDPLVYETLRSEQRQRWLYGIGRTHSKGRKPVTWTLKSKHLTGKAVDIVDRRKLWSAPPAFWTALKQEANREGMHTLAKEACHIQWG